LLNRADLATDRYLETSRIVTIGQKLLVIDSA